MQSRASTSRGWEDGASHRSSQNSLAGDVGGFSQGHTAAASGSRRPAAFAPFRVSLVKNAVQTFGKVVSCLNKVGKTLMMSADDNGLTLYAMNDSKSAMVHIAFPRSFFFRFAHTPPQAPTPAAGYGPDGGDGTSTKVSVDLRALTVVFRSVSSIELMELVFALPDDPTPCATFRLISKTGITKVNREESWIH